MISAKEAFQMLEDNGSLDITVELAIVERKIKDAIKEENYVVVIRLDEFTQVRKRKVLLTLQSLAYATLHCGGDSWRVSWY